MATTTPTLRRKWPFRRPAIVLSGGGAMGAYEIGVFRALETVGFRPKIVAGLSVGAINAVAWIANEFRPRPLERVWRTLRPSSIGMRWITLALRAIGGFVVLFAALEVVLTIAGSPELNLTKRLGNEPESEGYMLLSLVLEALAWGLVGAAGYALAILSRPMELMLARFGTPTDPERLQRWFAWALIVSGLLYVAIVAYGIPWPRRFHVSFVLAGIVVWFFNRRGKSSDWLRNMTLRLMPETGGRGLWRGEARRQLLQRLVRMGDAKLLVESNVHLIISACAVDTGRMTYFVNWDNPTTRFQEGIEKALGDVVPVLRPKDIIEAAVASCAVPLLFEPVRFRGRDYLDAGIFTNQPLQAVVADGADAILLVLIAPSGGLRKPSRHANVIELGFRLHELANWRDLQTELRMLPATYSREGKPANVCVVEPQKPLPGSLFGFNPDLAAELIRLGEADALRALNQAGWIE